MGTQSWREQQNHERTIRKAKSLQVIPRVTVDPLDALPRMLRRAKCPAWFSGPQPLKTTKTKFRVRARPTQGEDLDENKMGAIKQQLQKVQMNRHTGTNRVSMGRVQALCLRLTCFKALVCMKCPRPCVFIGSTVCQLDLPQLHFLKPDDQVLLVSGFLENHGP